MKQINIISVGKLKNTHLQKIEKDFLKRCLSLKINIIETKAYADNLEKESAEVLKKIKDLSKDSTLYPIILTEKGKLRNSVEFSEWLFKGLDRTNEKVTFILSGAYGFSKQLISLSRESISLSPLTFPHELARVLLVEQIYRAITIEANHPYHK